MAEVVEMDEAVRVQVAIQGGRRGEPPRAMVGLVRCDCCGTPVLAVQGDDLVIVAKHHGKHHTTRIAIASLMGDNGGSNKLG